MTQLSKALCCKIDEFSTHLKYRVGRKYYDKVVRNTNDIEFWYFQTNYTIEELFEQAYDISQVLKNKRVNLNKDQVKTCFNEMIVRVATIEKILEASATAQR